MTCFLLTTEQGEVFCQKTKAFSKVGGFDLVQAKTSHRSGVDRKVTTPYIGRELTVKSPSDRFPLHTCEPSLVSSSIVDEVSMRKDTSRFDTDHRSHSYHRIGPHYNELYLCETK
jgi:hypothetical protein